MGIRLSYTVAAVLACVPGYGQPVLRDLLNPAMANAGTAPGAVLVLKGSALAGDTRVAGVPPLPKELAGTRVLMDGIECPLLFVSADTIHAQLPFGIASERSSFNVSVKVRTPAGESAEFAIPMGLTQPVLVTESRDGQGQLTLLNESLQPVRSFKEGDVLLFYAMGLGETDPPATAGQAAPAGAPFSVRLPVQVLVGDQPAEVLSAVLAPGQAGVYEVKVRMPGGGGTMLRLRTEDGAREHSAALPPADANPKVADIAAELEAIGVPSAPSGFTPVLAAARFSISLTVPPGANPFDITLDGTPARIAVSVQPAAMSFSGTAVVPTAATRAGDFSATTMRVTDFFANGIPMPGNVVPMMRWPPQYVQATSGMAQPNEPGPAGSGTGIIHFSGIIPADGRLVINPATAPTTAGAWIEVQDKTAKGVAVTYRLSVDGQEVARKDAMIPVQ